MWLVVRSCGKQSIEIPLPANSNPEQVAQRTYGRGNYADAEASDLLVQGMGRTNTLAHRVANLWQRIDPGRILLLTFSARACD